MPAPAAARSHYSRLQRIHALVVATVRRTWSGMDPHGNWEQQYNTRLGTQISSVVMAGQIAAARSSDTYIADVVDELGLESPGPQQVGQLLPTTFTGWAGDGRPVETLLGQAPLVAGEYWNARLAETENELLKQIPTPQEALEQAQTWLDMVTETIIGDTARAAETVAMVQRPWLTGWVRMVVPPCCSRCAALAGRFYLHNDGFLRHPRCKCIHVPAERADFKGISANPNELFDSMTEAEQDKVFTIAGAKAIRLGADIVQVVNARRGMSTAQRNPRGWIPKGRLTRVASSGTDRGIFTTTEGTGSRRDTFTRLMPESVFELSDDRYEQIALLQQFGYITS